MRLGFIGLGRMGMGMAELLVEKGHEVVVYDITESARQQAQGFGAMVVASLAELVDQLPKERFVWIMVQRSVVQNVLDELQPLLSAGDTVVDGGNTFYKESIERARAAADAGIHYLDVGVSGGVTAARNGACLMIGGETEIFKKYEPLLRDLAAQDGYAHVGAAGAGHLVKGLHNGIEYGMMQAIGDGFEAIMQLSEQFSLDPKAVLRVYNHGSIVESKLTGWLEQAWQADDQLASISGSVPTGDTEAEMIELSQLTNNPSLKLAIAERQRSQQQPRFAGKVIAAMRNQFGGHATLPSESKKA